MSNQEQAKQLQTAQQQVQQLQQQVQQLQQQMQQLQQAASAGAGATDVQRQQLEQQQKQLEEVRKQIDNQAKATEGERKIIDEQRKQIDAKRKDIEEKEKKMAEFDVQLRKPTVTPHNTHTQLKHTHNFEIPGATGSHPEGAGSILRRAGDAQGAVGIGADPSHEGRPRPGGDANGSGSSQGALREIARHSAETPGN